jgi:hypothetical protein
LVCVKNALGGVAAAPAVTLVRVAPRVFGSAAAQADFLTSLAASASASAASAASAAPSATTAALARLTAAASTLNDDPNSPLNGAAAAAAARATLLSAVRDVSSSAAAAAATATPEALQAAPGAVAALLRDEAQINAAGAAIALDILSSIASAGATAAVTNATSFAIAASLSSIAAAAATAALPAPEHVLARVSDIVDALAAAQLASLSVPGEPPIDVWSRAIRMRVSLDDADAAAAPGARLFTQRITAPGALASFAALPAGVFGGGAAPPAVVRTQFASLAFDPYAAADGSRATGVTRLAFFNDTSGAEVPVERLSTPLYFSLPPVPRLLTTPADDDATTTVVEAHAQCQFWDAAAAAYATRGCVALPDPAPPGHTLAWAQNFVAGTDADMAAAWRITGPLLDDEACTTRVLDCSPSAAPEGLAFPNPAAPLRVPGVACDANVSAAPMLLFVGARCALIRADNAFGCAWDNALQSFTGAGCVARSSDDEPTQCACRHLTSFASARAPSVPRCAAWPTSPRCSRPMSWCSCARCSQLWCRSLPSCSSARRSRSRWTPPRGAPRWRG